MPVNINRKFNFFSNKRRPGKTWSAYWVDIDKGELF